MENRPEWLAAQVKGISLKVAIAASEELREKSGMRAAMLFFREWFGAALTVKIYKRWGNAAVDIVRKNPYLLCEEVEGIGFERADRFAEKLGVPHDSPERIKSGLHYILLVNSMHNGHVCLPDTKLIHAAAELLGVEVGQCRAALDELVGGGRLVSDLRGGERFVYLPAAYECENT